jgi:hypothetical protein
VISLIKDLKNRNLYGICNFRGEGGLSQENLFRRLVTTMLTFKILIKWGGGGIWYQYHMHQIKYLWPGITAVSQPCCFMPKAFEKCGLYPINQEKALERIPSVFQSHTVTRHLDNALLKKLEIHQFGEWKKKPRGQKVPAGQSNTKDKDNETT